MSTESDNITAPIEAFNAAVASATSQREVIMESSPTGNPLLPILKGDLGKILAGVVGVAAVVFPLVPAHTLLAKVLGIVVGLGGAIGIASPGLRSNSQQ